MVSVMLFLALALSANLSPAQPIEKVRVGMPSFSLSFIAPQVAQAKGFFQAEGLEVELIQMATNISLVALTPKISTIRPHLGRLCGARLTALLAGKVDAAILPPPFNFEAESKGFRRLLAAADVFEASTSGLSLHVDKLRDSAGQVKRMIRALLKTQSFIRDNKSETVKVIAEWLKLDPAVAALSYDLYVRGLSSDGLVSDRVLELDIERARQSLKIKEPVPINKVVDFSILKEVLHESKVR